MWTGEATDGVPSAPRRVRRRLARLIRRTRHDKRPAPVQRPQSPWLADDLLHSFGLVPGSREREHLMALMRRARRIRLDDEVTAAAARTVRHAPWSLERHAGRVSLDIPALWLEYGHAPRLAVYGSEMDGIAAPVTVGCLLAADPGAPDHVAAFVSWRLPVQPDAPPGTLQGAIHHSYALLHWDLAAFEAAARVAPARDDGASPTRMMGLARASVPPGLMSELEVWQGIKAANDPMLDAAVARTERDVLGEHLFLASALLMLGSSAVDLSPEAVNEEGEHSSDTWLATLAPGTGRAPWPWTPSGFRAQLLGGPLAWSDPEQAA